jgi:hypothetical protein
MEPFVGFTTEISKILTCHKFIRKSFWKIDLNYAEFEKKKKIGEKQRNETSATENLSNRCFFNENVRPLILIRCGTKWFFSFAFCLFKQTWICERKKCRSFGSRIVTTFMGLKRRTVLIAKRHGQGWWHVSQPCFCHCHQREEKSRNMSLFTIQR